MSKLSHLYVHLLCFLVMFGLWSLLKLTKSFFFLLGMKQSTIAICQGKTLIDNLTAKEDLRLSAEGVLDHPFLSSHRSSDVKQQLQMQQYQAELQESKTRDTTAKHMLEQEHLDPKAKMAKKPRLVLIANDTPKSKSSSTSENIVKVPKPHTHPIPPSSK